MAINSKRNTLPSCLIQGIVVYTKFELFINQFFLNAFTNPSPGNLFLHFMKEFIHSSNEHCFEKGVGTPLSTLERRFTTLQEELE